MKMLNPTVIYAEYPPAFGYKVLPLHKVTAPEYAIKQKGHLGSIAKIMPGSHDAQLLCFVEEQLLCDVHFFMN